MNEKKIEDFVLSVRKGRTAPVLHLQDFLSSSELTSLKEYMESLTYTPLENEGKVARNEVFLDRDSHHTIEGQIELLEKVRRTLPDFVGVDYEVFGFEHAVGHEIPFHYDKPRHKLVSLLYLGNFEGGEYVYEFEGTEHIIALKENDVIIAINYVGEDRVGVNHRVARVSSGARYALSTSLCQKK